MEIQESHDSELFLSFLLELSSDPVDAAVPRLQISQIGQGVRCPLDSEIFYTNFCKSH